MAAVSLAPSLLQAEGWVQGNSLMTALRSTDGACWLLIQLSQGNASSSFMPFPLIKFCSSQTLLSLATVTRKAMLIVEHIECHVMSQVSEWEAESGLLLFQEGMAQNWTQLSRTCQK